MPSSQTPSPTNRSLWTRLLPNLPHPHPSTVLASLVPLLAPSIATMGMGATSAAGSSSSSDLLSLQPVDTSPPASSSPSPSTDASASITSRNDNDNVECCDCRIRQMCDTANGPGHTFVYGSTLKSCAICLDEYQPGDRLRVLDPCGHAFHTACIDQWFDNELYHHHHHTTAPGMMAPYHFNNYTSTSYLPCPVCKTPILIHSLPPKSVRRQRPNAQQGQVDVNNVDVPNRDSDSNSSGGSRRDDEERQPWAHVQLIDLSVHQSWVEWFQQVWKVAELGGNSSTPRRRL